MAKETSKLSHGAMFRKLENTEFSIKATGQPYRVINNWDKHELLRDSRLNPQGWRRFNWFELTWARMIAEMRKFGLSLQSIKHVKESLFVPSKENSWTEFDEIVMTCLGEEEDYLLIVESDGSTQVSLSRPDSPMPSLIIPFQTIIRQVVNEEEQVAAKDAAESSLNPELRKAINYIREADFEKIILSFDDSRPLIIRKGADKKMVKKVLETVTSSEFKRIMILRPKGKVFALEGSAV